MKARQLPAAFVLLSITVTAAVARGTEAAPNTGAVSETPAQEQERIRELYRQGAAAFARKDAKKAYQNFLSAWEIRKSYDVAASLGQVELILHLDVDAANHLDFAVKNFPPQLSAEALSQVREAFDVARGRVGAIRLHVNTPNAEVRVDGKPVGKTPLTGPLYVESGPHTVAAVDGSDQVSTSVVLGAGTEQALTLNLVHKPKVTPPEPQRPLPTHARHASTAPIIVGSALAVVGAGVGVGFAIISGNKDDDARSLRKTIPGDGACTGASPNARCSELRDTVEERGRARNISTAAFISAGAVAMLTGVYWLAQSTQESPKAVAVGRSKIRLDASISTTGATTWLTGEF